MLDLERYAIPLDCPNCAFMNPATLRQVRLRDVIICRGCKRNIQLEDHRNEVRRSLREVRRAVAEFTEALDSLNTTITIKF